MTPDQRRIKDKLRMRKRRRENPEASRKATRRYYAKNRETVLAKTREWNAANPNYKAEYRRARLALFAERAREYRARKKWRAWVRRLADSRRALSAH